MWGARSSQQRLGIGQAAAEGGLERNGALEL